MTSVAARPCPQCSAELPVLEGFATWCHQCGWNLRAPEQRDAPSGRIERLYDVAGRRLGERLIEKMVAAGNLEPRLTPTRAAAYAIAIFVHMLSLGLFAGGAALIAFALPNPFAIAGGVVMLGAGFLMRPRLGKPPTDGVVLRRDTPALYDFVDSIAEGLDTRTVDMIVVDHEYNASWAILGFRRRRVLTLGLPLFSVLQPQERVALVAHELAHGRNGDSSHGLVVGSAVGALSELYYLVAPDSEEVDRDWEFGGFEFVLNGLFWLLSRPVYGLLLLELHLLLRDSQRAEFLADALAARAAGTSAVIALHEKLLLHSTFRSVIQDIAHDRGRSRPELFAVLAQAFAAVPERERERRRRVARLEGAKLGATHPPTAHRLRVLEERRPVEPLVVLHEDASAEIDAALAESRNALEQRLVEDYRDSLYYG